MKRLTTTLMAATLAIGCGGAGSNHQTSMPATSAVHPEADPFEDSTARPAAAEPAAPTPFDWMDNDTPEQPPPLPAPKPAQPEAVAKSDLQQVDGSTAAGVVTFAQNDRRITITGTFSGLEPGLHGFLIHENGDCRAKAKRVGKHFNPTNAEHGPPESSERHAGDFGNLLVDDSGVATFAMETDSLTVTAGPDSVVGLAIVVHARKDDGKTQPSGTSGPAVACGVIELEPTKLAAQ